MERISSRIVNNETLIYEGQNIIAKWPGKNCQVVEEMINSVMEVLENV